ncbi:MAG: hypothetical protein IV100_17325 [Myxococcales bacterium]|nr:hypothetical protein [Myxococcales bacterium]
MEVHVALTISMTFVAAACAGTGETTEPTTTFPSSAITFDDSATLIKGAELQALLKAVDGQLAANVAADKASDDRIAELETERDALRAVITALAARVQVLEDSPPPVIDVLATNVVSDILPAATLLVTLESLHEWVSVLPTLQSDVALLDGTTSALTSLSSALTECPEGTSAAGDFCMEVNARGEDSWSNATYFCAIAGGHVCSTGELSGACKSPGPLQPGVSAPELTTNIVIEHVSGISGAIQLFDGESCDFLSDKVSLGNIAPYRCCYDRLVIGAGPKPTEPAIP